MRSLKQPVELANWWMGITNATQLQTQEFQSVTKTMTEVATIANKTSEDSKDISSSFKELLAMAQNLQRHADQFKSVNG
jgi:methyl-accepting chemotaxis protein PixJ